MKNSKKLLKKLKNSSISEKTDIIIRYCEVYILAKNQKKIREEDVAYEICHLTFLDDIYKNPLFTELIDHACDMETPRETNIGAGLDIHEVWNKEYANSYKEKQYQTLLDLFEVIKNK